MFWVIVHVLPIQWHQCPACTMCIICVAVCCSVLQCVAVRCSVWRWSTVGYSGLQCVAVFCNWFTM